MEGDLVLTVAYTGEPDELFEFDEEGKGRLFGRDDAACDIVIWSAINGTELSRVAGRIWRTEGELWLRNLSTRHDLHLSQPGLPEEAPLPPRRDDGRDPGPARSIPGDVAYVRGPGGCELVVHQRRASFETDRRDDADMTSHVPPVPEHLRAVAAALCAPLLSGSQLPAAYSEIMKNADTGSLKRTRTLVAELCAPYVAEVPHLRERIIARQEREERELELPAEARLRGGVWTYEQTEDRSAEPEEIRRRRALALPDYYEVAHLLVRRRLVAGSDLRQLRDPRSEPPRPEA